MADQAMQQPLQVRPAEAGKVQTAAAQPVQPVHQAPHPRALRTLVIAVGAHEHDLPTRWLAGQEREHFARGRISPVQILEDHEQGTLGAVPLKNGPHGSQQPGAPGLPRRPGTPDGKLYLQEAGDCLSVPASQALRCRRPKLPNYLQHRSEGHEPRRHGRAAANHNPGAPGRCLTGELGHETGLADARLTAYEHPARVPVNR